MTDAALASPQDDPDVRKGQEERLEKVWETPKGVRYWSAVNNSEVGIWYTATALFFFLFAGVLGLLIRTQLAVPDNDFLSATFYNQVFTLHGTAMMFLFAIPIFEAVAILILPEMLGARDLPSRGCPPSATGASCSAACSSAARSSSTPRPTAAGSCTRR